MRQVILELVEGEDLVCAYVSVPERHERPGGDRIRLAVATFRSTATEPAAEPLVLERGGPGESTLGTFIPALASPIGERLRARRDLVLVEQRGTFYSQPSLSCPEWNAEMEARLPLRLTSTEERTRDLESIHSCYRRLLAEGIDLSAYNSLENAADIPFVLTSLGYDTFHLFGTSAGTLLAQHILRDYPGRLRSVILDSPLPLDARPYAEFVIGATQSLERRFEACEASAGCRARYPDLGAELLAAIERFNSQPVSVEVPHPQTGATFEILLTGDRLGELVYNLLSDTETVPVLPLLTRMLAEGDLSLLSSYGAALFPPPTFSRGMQYSVLCAEEIDFTADEIELAGMWPEFERIVAGIWPHKLLEGCGFWQVEELLPLANLPVESDVPTLVISGEYDILPADYGPKVARSLSSAYVVTVPGAAHTPSGSGDCALSLVEGFLADPGGPLDQTCLGEIETRFVTEDFARRLLLPQPPIGRLLVLLAAVLVLLSTFLAWRKRSPTALHRRSELTVAALNLSYLAVFVAGNPLNSMYGVPPLLDVASLLPVLSILPLTVSAVATHRMWRERRGTPIALGHCVLVILAGVTFVWQLGWWHLLPWQ